MLVVVLMAARVQILQCQADIDLLLKAQLELLNLRSLLTLDGLCRLQAGCQELLHIKHFSLLMVRSSLCCHAHFNLCQMCAMVLGPNKHSTAVSISCALQHTGHDADDMSG